MPVVETQGPPLLRSYSPLFVLATLHVDDILPSFHLFLLSLASCLSFDELVSLSLIEILADLTPYISLHFAHLSRLFACSEFPVRLAPSYCISVHLLCGRIVVNRHVRFPSLENALLPSIMLL